MTMITPSYLGETIEYSSLHACRSTLEDPTHLRAALAKLTAESAGLVAGAAHQHADSAQRMIGREVKSLAHG